MMKLHNSEAFFSAFISSDLLVDYNNLLLKKINEDNLNVSTLLFESDSFFISTSYTIFRKEKIQASSPRERFISLLTGELEYRLYKQDKNIISDTFDNTKKLILEKEGILRKGEILHLYEFEHVLCPLKDYQGVIISLEFKNIADYFWYYDMDTLLPLYYNFADKSDKRLEGTIELLSEIGNEKSIEPLYNLTFHANHTIRWKSLECLINLDYERGLDVLKRMASTDKHSEIKRAAQSSLKRILSNQIK